MKWLLDRANASRVERGIQGDSSLPWLKSSIIAFALLAMLAQIAAVAGEEGRPADNEPRIARSLREPDSSRPAGQPIPRNRRALPEYIIEPPDILTLEVVGFTVDSSYCLTYGDELSVTVQGPGFRAPWTRVSEVSIDGRVDLGPVGGEIQVDGKFSDAQRAIEHRLGQVFVEPQSTVTLKQLAVCKKLKGEHVVAPDGTISLGPYGRASVAGLTIERANEAIEASLAFLPERPRVSIDVLAYNSKVYYIITKNPGSGDRVVRVPITGNETVLDAVAQVGLPISVGHIWIARPAANGAGHEQILQVNWEQITHEAATQSNYQVLPGDRIYISPTTTQPASDDRELALELRGLREELKSLRAEVSRLHAAHDSSGAQHEPEVLEERFRD